MILLRAVADRLLRHAMSSAARGGFGAGRARARDAHARADGTVSRRSRRVGEQHDRTRSPRGWPAGILALAGAFFASAPLPAQDVQPVDSSYLAGLEYRMVGPYRGGRVTAVTGVRGRPHTFFMGSTGGGVWRTDDAGETWSNVSDGFFEVGSIGAIEVAAADPNVVYVGTGSGGIRGNVSTGRGMYRSTDGGESWTHVGLREAGLVNRVITHPHDADLVYVAALGHPFGKNPERGVYRSTDGGETWEHVLFVSDSTGAIDLSMNVHNPREIYAAFWRAERKPWTLIDASEDGGVYKTSDGGDTWRRLEGGLPTGLTGRIGLSVSPANPKRVYALVNARDPDGGVYRSDDAGDTWTRVNRERDLRQRHWYYSHIDADPQDENTVYARNTGFYRSVDAGKTFERIRVPHGDVHDLWINPDDPEIMILSNDGGAQVTLTGGLTWSTMYNQPTAELYRVTVDDRFPYRVYGAQQDNTTISVPSASPGDITPTQEWYSVAGAESGHIAVTPGNPDLVYAGNYIGRIDRYDHRTRTFENVTIYPQMQDGTAPKDLKYRFQWNAPILVSAHDADVVYHASNHVHRTADGGKSWETISPDLTTDDETQQELPGGPLQHDHTGVEVYNTVFALAESPYQAAELWAGSDDGLIHVTRDDGGSWVDVTPTGMPDEGTVNTIELSVHSPGRAFVAVYNYRMDDFSPYVFRTDDWGASWRLLTDGRNGIPGDFPVRVVREDPQREGLLYAGTEFGMFVSFDGGRRWQPFQLNLPVTPITDMKVYRNDLVVATQGRSFWILDDLTPLHQLSDDVLAADRHLFTPRDAYRVRLSGYRGPRAPEPTVQGASIHFYVEEVGEDEEVRLEVLDGAGAAIRTFSSAKDDRDAGREGRVEEDTEGDASNQGELEEEMARDPGPDQPDDDDIEELDVNPGLNRFVWDLEYPGPDLAEGAVMSLGYTGGALAPPGPYQVRLSVGDWSETRSFELLPDPRIPIPAEDYAAQFDLVIRVRDRLTDAHEAVTELRSIRDQVDQVAKRVREGRFPAGLKSDVEEAADSLERALTAVEDELIQSRQESGQDPLNFPSMIDDQLAYLYGHVNEAIGRPTRGSYERFEDLDAELTPILAEVRALLDGAIADFNRLLEEGGVGPIIYDRPVT